MSEEFEAFDRAWKLPGKRLELELIRSAAEALTRSYEGLKVKVDWEDDDTVTCFFTVEEDGAAYEIELSVYDLDSDGRVLSLEADAADNSARFEDACQLAEDLAEALGGWSLDL